ncbi:MAG: J domain-containing protein [Pseudomonadota bacterium]
MGNSSKNPFEIFGLTPEVTARLEEQDLFALVKAQYRTLQKVYHPDCARAVKGKADPKDKHFAVELNLAFEKLNLDKDPGSFRRYHRLYAARQNRGLRKKIVHLEKDIQKNLEKQAALADGFMIYLLHKLPWQSNGDDEYDRPGLSPTNIRLGLNDVAINHNIRTLSWNLGSNYKEIIFDALGGMYYRPVGRSQPFPVNYIQLLGAVDMNQIDLLPLLNRVPPRPGFFRSPALDSRCGIDGPTIEVLNTISLEKFKQHCLPLLRPELKERSYLFSVHRPLLEKDGHVSLEGLIVKISKP